MTLGSAVKRMRAAAGFSQKDFAARLDLSQSYLSQIESDRREPTIPLVRRMAGELGVPSVILFAAALSRPSAMPEEQRKKLSAIMDQLIEAAGIDLAQLAFSLRAQS
jgi:transcriptional regulator with XRE-family HTH domain